jgi:hypothetical protein
MSGPCPALSPSARRRSASRDRRLWIRFASSAGRCALSVAMPCSPGVRVTCRASHAARWRRAAPAGSSSPMAPATAPRHALTPAPSISGRRSPSTSSTSRRCSSVSGAVAEAVAKATPGATFPRPRAVSMRGIAPTRRRAAARLVSAVEGERRVARVMSTAVRRSACRMSCSSSGRRSSSWATSSRTASIRSRRPASASATSVRTSSAARELSAPWIMSSRFLISLRGRVPISNISCGETATEVRRWSTSPRSSASADGPPVCSAASIASGVGCSGGDCRDDAVTMPPSCTRPTGVETPAEKCGQQRAAALGRFVGTEDRA